MAVRDVDERPVSRYLMPHEGRTIVIRRHPAALLVPWAVTLCGLIAAAVATFFVDSGLVLALIWIGWAVLLGWQAWKFAAWKLAYFLVTEHRVMLITGVLGRRVDMMPLAKVTDLTVDRSFLGRLLGYGTVVLESPGQDQALQNVEYMPDPEAVYLEISALAFESKDGSPD